MFAELASVIPPYPIGASADKLRAQLPTSDLDLGLDFGLVLLHNEPNGRLSLFLDRGAFAYQRLLRGGGIRFGSSPTQPNRRNGRNRQLGRENCSTNDRPP